MSLCPLTDRQEIRQAFDLLEERFAAGSQRVERALGWHGGGGIYELYWHPRVRLWGVLSPDQTPSRYWCAFGTEDPTTPQGLSLVCEINSPFEGINRRCAGVFARDDDGKLYLAHTGKVGGGRPGIGKAEFTAAYGGERQTLRWPDGQLAVVFPVGRLNEPELVDQIARFVREVEQFKQSVHPHGYSAGAG